VTDEAALLRLDLPDRTAAPAAARKALTALNGSMRLVSEARLRDAQLIVSELVANAVRHSGVESAAVRVEVRATPEVMRVEGSDDGEGFDPHEIEPPSPGRGGGWGLTIVGALAHRWGVERGSHTTVWFEIDRPHGVTPLAVHRTPPSDGSG
jgi:anti-sigma regulatory factor (Ser/Thr protein kinase)